MLSLLVCCTSILACGSGANDGNNAAATAGSTSVRVTTGGQATRASGGTAADTARATSAPRASQGGEPSQVNTTTNPQLLGGASGTASGGEPAAVGGLPVAQTNLGAAGKGLGGSSNSDKPSGGGAVAGGKSSTSSHQIGGAPVTGFGGASVKTIAAAGTNASGGKVATGTSRGGAAFGGKTSSGEAAGRDATGGKSVGGQAAGGTSSSASPLSCNSTLPAYTTSTTVSATITVSGTKDYAMQRICADPSTLGDGDQSENQKPVFMLAKGAVLKNVIIGGTDNCSAADGVHCESGSCTLENVWIGNVGEDAVTFKGSDSSQVMTINGGGAFEASDKVIQHNGPGTIKVNGFLIKNAGKLYRSCGNCSTQYERHIELTDIFASGIKSVLVGVNANYGDSARINSLTECGSVKAVCETFTGNDTGDEPSAIKTYTSSGDGKACIFTEANIK